LGGVADEEQHVRLPQRGERGPGVAGVQPADAGRVDEHDVPQQWDVDPHLDTEHRIGDLTDGRVVLDLTDVDGHTGGRAERVWVGQHGVGLVVVAVTQLQPAGRGHVGANRAEQRTPDKTVDQSGLPAFGLPADDDPDGVPTRVGPQVVEDRGEIVPPASPQLRCEPGPQHVKSSVHRAACV
jgi:hypothetical protein